MKFSVDTFKQTIKQCRSQETALDPKKRSLQHPSYSQCLLTALLASDELWFSVHVERLEHPERKRGMSHFFNKDANNNEVRFCEEQFNNLLVIQKSSAKLFTDDNIRILLERYPEVKQKYKILKHTFQEELEKNPDNQF